MPIKHISMDHGWYYFYRLHKIKTENLTKEFPQLKEYLHLVFDERPDDFFLKGPRSSHLKFPLPNITLLPIEKHEVMELTKIGLKENAHRYKSGHSKVQVYMLENDNHTLAVEVPLWLEPKELEQYYEIFGSNLPLTGHIDVLRIEDDKIFVWDYKPRAKYEKYAATQVYFYALMLSKRTGIPLDKFACGYFDEKNTYAFNPIDCSIS